MQTSQRQKGISHVLEMAECRTLEASVITGFLGTPSSLCPFASLVLGTEYSLALEMPWKGSCKKPLGLSKEIGHMDLPMNEVSNGKMSALHRGRGRGLKKLVISMEFFLLCFDCF